MNAGTLNANRTAQAPDACRRSVHFARRTAGDLIVSALHALMFIDKSAAPVGAALTPP